MADPVYACDEHGYFVGESCPTCGDSDRGVIDATRRERLSRFVSGALRHFPDDVGIELDENGWVDHEELVTAVDEKFSWTNEEQLDAVLATDPKGRFEHSGDRVRATYGHSVPVELDGEDAPIPDVLYHGTAPRSVEPILEEGLKAMGRQAVHLSDSVADAREVGERHAPDATILEVDAEAMREDGHDITKRGKTVYTTSEVPPAYLSVR